MPEFVDAGNRVSTGTFSRGDGPGAISPDGCAVEVYAALPARDEPSIVHAAAPAGAAILELGSGPGRITHELIALGHPVVAVDESGEMLARVRGARTVRSRIEDLDLPERFDVVLLSSHLVNVPDDDVLAKLLSACARHVTADGVVLIQRFAPRWFDEVADKVTERDGATIRLYDVTRPAPDLVSATVEYRIGDRTWWQSFTSRHLDDSRLQAALAAAGLRFDGMLTDDGAWVRARPRG